MAVQQWINKSVRLNDSWGPGAAHTLTTPVGAPPEFSFRPRHLRDSHGKLKPSHILIEFPSGYLPDGWMGAVFMPMGHKAVSGISGLPQWDPSHQARYRSVITAAAGSLTDSRTERLEAVVPYLNAKGDVGYNMVRLFYVVGAVQGPVPDLVVIKIATHAAVAGTVQGRQDGDGHGPPG
jgi:hypothetical protein